MHAQRKRHVLEHIQIGKQGATLKQHTHLLAHVEQLGTRQGRQVLAVDPDFALGRFELGGNQAQQGRLAAPGRPHDAGDLAARDKDIDVIENLACATLKGNPFQLNRIGILGTHLDSLCCRHL